MTSHLCPAWCLLLNPSLSCPFLPMIGAILEENGILEIIHVSLCDLRGFIITLGLLVAWCKAQNVDVLFWLLVWGFLLLFW